MQRYLFSILAFLICLSGYARHSSLDALYDSIDYAIAHTEEYVALREAGIAKIHHQLSKAATEKERIALNKKLYEEYRAYRNDSTMAVLQRLIAIGEKTGDKSLVNQSKSKLAFQCSTVGSYSESMRILESINPADLDRSEKSGDLLYYYKALTHVYQEQAYYSGISKYQNECYARSDQYRPLYIAEARKHDKFLYCQELMMEYYRKNQLAQALKISDQWLKMVKKGDRNYAIVAYYRYIVVAKMKRMSEAKYWLAQSAISDITHAVMDQGALWALANLINEDGDPDRAYAYINFSWNCAQKFGTRLRSIQISPILSVIETNYQKKLNTQNKQLISFIFVVSLMAVILLLMLIYMNKQRNNLAEARNKLRNINDKLFESNQIKEEYIAKFMAMCSEYVDKMETMRKKIGRLVKSHNYEELANLTHSTTNKDKELEALYDNFDKTFLKLFPTFVDEFNALLKPESRVQLAEDNRMPVTLRIFALIRLGIDDSSRIAEFLHYSVNTIYNYRARMKNGVLEDRENFEKRVKELGQISR